MESKTDNDAKVENKTNLMDIINALCLNGYIDLSYGKMLTSRYDSDSIYTLPIDDNGNSIMHILIKLNMSKYNPNVIKTIKISGLDAIFENTNNDNVKPIDIIINCIGYSIPKENAKSGIVEEEEEEEYENIDKKALKTYLLEFQNEAIKRNNSKYADICKQILIN